MAIRRLSRASIKTGSKSNKMWDQDTAQGAMEFIASADMNGTVTAFGFTSIPQIYQDLVLVLNLRGVVSANGLGWIINGNPSGVTYGTTLLKGDGASASSVRGSSMSYGASQVGVTGSTSGIHSTVITHFLNYTNSTRKKTWLSRFSTDLVGSGYTAIEVMANSQTTAITNIDCSTANASVFWTGTVRLYGIKAGA
jgi:hypothetical protein